MAIDYSDFAEKTRSQKLTLCHIEASQRLSLFSLDSGAIYKKNADYFVVNVKEDGQDLIENGDSLLTSGQWYYDPITSVLYIRTTDDSNPKTKRIIVTYRMFFANMPISLPYDLIDGVEVYYEGRLKNNNPTNKEIDEEQIGIVLETSTSVVLENRDGFFDDFFDVLIFENKSVKLWSWSELILLSDRRKLFDGIIENKSINESQVTFSCKDFTYNLREPLDLSNFTRSDGDVPERFLNTPKRRLFGQFKQLRCVPIDSVLGGISGTGTVSAQSGSTTFTGVGTSFLDELSPEDQIIIENEFESLRYNVASVTSDTSFEITQELDRNIASTSFIFNPKIPWRKKNRRWHIAGHKLRNPITTVSSSISGNRFSVVSGDDIFAGDLVTVDGEEAFIRRNFEGDITLSSVLQGGRPSIGAVVSKSPVSKVYLTGVEAFVNRDWTIQNATEAILTLDELSEFNIAPQVALNFDLQFSNGSRVVTVSGLDVRTEFGIRDWIRSGDIVNPDWYEILDIRFDEDTSISTITLRTEYIGPNITDVGFKKNVSVINDESVVTVDCIGQERSGKWIKTASDAVQDILENDSGLSNLDIASFIESKYDAPFVLSYKIPFEIGGSNKSIKEVISDINSSVFGSLVINNDFDLRYQVLNPEIPEDLEELRDDDILGVSSINTRNNIVRSVESKYQFFSDRFTGDTAFNSYIFVSEFVDDLVGSKSKLELDLYLFNEDDATTITQRYALYNSLSQSVITLRGKLNLALKVLNDKLYLNLDRLYKRFGNRTKRKVGIVNKVSNNGSEVSISINDLGNAFNRVANISADAANDFTSADDDEKIKYNYIVDDDILTPDVNSDDEIFTNSIG